MAQVKLNSANGKDNKISNNPGPCYLCGKTHTNNKEDNISSPGWKRESITGLGSRHVTAKQSIYPQGTAPPTVYKSAGHHCVALSAFINTKKQDINLKLNFYLDKAGYSPNNLDNCIDLPSSGSGATIYPEFEAALRSGNPLQIHIGRHVKNYFRECNTLTQDLFNFFSDLDECQKPEKQWLEELLKAMELLEDEAFQKTANREAPFVLHPTPLRSAEEQAHRNGLGPINYPQLTIWS